MKKIFLLLVASLLTMFACQMLSPLPDENKIKSDLIGKKLLVDDEEVWSFVTLSEFNSFHIAETQKADRTAEFTVNSCFKNLDDNRKFYGEYICTYKFDDSNKWILGNVLTKKFGEVDSAGRLFSSQTENISEVETEVEPENYVWYEFEVTNTMQNAKATGNFETDDLIDVAIADAKVVKALENRTRPEAKPIFDSGFVSSKTLDAPLKTGKYVLIFGNPTAGKTTTVKSKIELSYDKNLGTNSECR